MRKKLLFCSFIFFHRFMEVEMILGKVCEDADIEIKGADTIERNSDRAYFHYTGRNTGCNHVAKHYRKLSRFGSSKRPTNKFIADIRADRADQTGILSATA